MSNEIINPEVKSILTLFFGETKENMMMVRICVEWDQQTTRDNIAKAMKDNSILLLKGLDPNGVGPATLSGWRGSEIKAFDVVHKSPIVGLDKKILMERN